MGMDDPLDAVAVHGGGGLWGLLCVPFFMSAGLKEGERGIIFDGHLGHPWTVLGVQVAAIAAILAWSVFWSTIIFGSMKLIKMLRVSTEVEFKDNKGATGGGKGPTNPVMAGSAEITGITTMDGDKKNIDGEVFNNPFQLPAARNGGGGVENRGMAMEKNGGTKA